MNPGIIGGSASGGRGGGSGNALGTPGAKRSAMVVGVGSGRAGASGEG
jgi:hypothetical protein